MLQLVAGAHLHLDVVITGLETADAGGELVQAARDVAREEEAGNHRDKKRATTDREREEQLLALALHKAADPCVRLEHRDRLARAIENRRVAADPATVFVLIGGAARRRFRFPSLDELGAISGRNSVTAA